MSDERLTDLEARFVWLERHETDHHPPPPPPPPPPPRLRRELASLQGRMRNAAGEGEPEAEEPPPPHY